MKPQAPRTRIRSVGCALTLCVATLSCSGDAEPLPQSADLAPGESYGDWGSPADTSAPVSPATSAPVTSASTPATNEASNGAVDDEAIPEALALADGYARTTADGIRLSGGPTTFDYGDGTEPSFEVSGRSGSGHAKLVVPREPAWPLDGAVDTLGWVLSSNTFAVIILTSDDVASVRVLGLNGSVDQTTPTDGIAVAGVPASSIDDITVEAFDAAGNIIGRCAADDVFLNCA